MAFGGIGTNNNPTSPMSLTGRAAVLDLGLGSDLAQQAAETEEERKKRLMGLMGENASSSLGLGQYGL